MEQQTLPITLLMWTWCHGKDGLPLVIVRFCFPDSFLFLVTRYMDIPPVSRLYLTGAFLTTAACAVDIISPFSLYFNWELVVGQGQIWRLLTSYLFFGVFSIDFLFHMYFLVRGIFALSCWKSMVPADDYCEWNRCGTAGCWRKESFVDEQRTICTCYFSE